MFDSLGEAVSSESGDSTGVALSDVWNSIVGSIQETVGASRVRAWLGPARLLEIDSSTEAVVLAVPNPFLADRVRSFLLEPLEEALGRTLGWRHPTVHLVVDPDIGATDPDIAHRAYAPTRGRLRPASPASAPSTPAAEPHASRPSVPPLSEATTPSGAPISQEHLPPSLSPKYTFDTFVVGDSNRLAHHAAQAVAEQPAQVYNPLFLHGGAGLGKTHLLHAIGIAVLRNFPNKKVEYVTSETFINDFITAIRYDRTHQFKQRYRSVDVLLVDDIQFLANSERTQEEFFHTFNELYNDDKQIVITSDQPPSHIGNIESRLRSRFSLGLTADIQAPDFETRIAILRRLSENHRVTIPDEVLTYIAHLFTDNIRELQGALTRVIACATIHRSPVTLEMAKRELESHRISSPTTARPISPELIMQEVASYFGLTLQDLTSPARRRSIVQARHVAMYLCRTLTDLSLPQIGSLFGGRDHTTVLHSIRKIDSSLKQQPTLLSQVRELVSRINSLARAAVPTFDS